MARHSSRPQAIDYIGALFTDFIELSGDRLYAEDAAIIAGLAKFNDQPVVVIGQQKGRDTAEKINRNFGMAGPEGYRKALRMMDLADKFSLPLMTFVDTPAPTPESAPKSAGNPAQLGGVYTVLSLCARPFWRRLLEKAAPAALWLWRPVIIWGCCVIPSIRSFLPKERPLFCGKTPPHG